MTALLRKDLYMIRKQMWLLFAIVLCFSFTPQFNRVGTIYLLVLSMSLSQTSIAYDERFRWDKFAAMLPVPPWKIVLSKYLFMALSVSCTGCTAVIVNCVQCKFLGGSVSVPRTTALFFTVMTVNAFFLPVIYRFGTEKARPVLAAVCLGGAAVIIGGVMMDASAVIRIFGPLVKLMEQSALQLIFGSAALAAAGNALSFCLSVQFYANRRYGVYDS